MSEREFLDLDEDLVEASSDSPVGEWDDDLMDDFPADDPAAQELGNAATPTPAPVKGESKPKEKKAGKAAGKPDAPRGKRLSASGFYFFLLVLLAGLTLGAGLLTATGAVPEQLLDFSGFRDPLTIGDFRAHPVNAFWLAAAVTLMAAVLAAVAVGKRLQGLETSLAEQDRLLDALRTLDPEDAESWQREELQSDPDLVAVTTGLMGHASLQQAKLNRYVGLEGELHRLEKAMAEDSQTDLNGSWENPAVGSLADQALRLIRDREEASRNNTAQRQNLDAQGPDLVAGLRDARGWNSATHDQLNVQGASLDRLSRRLNKLAEAVPQDTDISRRRDRLRQALEAIKQTIENLPTRAAAAGETGDAGFTTLIERASRLAFQIAMEVARLGAKGERLLPLTQDLEELTTELRAVADRGKPQQDGEDPRERALETVRGRLAELDPGVLQGDGEDSAARAVAELAPVAGQAATALVKIGKDFNAQTDRLGQLTSLASELTGIELADLGDPQSAPGGMLVDRFDPFASGAKPEGGLVADPFASSGGSIFDAGNGGGSEFTQTILPGEESSLVESPQPACEEPAALVLDPPTPAPAAPADPAPAAQSAGPASASVEEPLPQKSEKVYDLSEFDAVPMTAGSGADLDKADRIIDLEELGAVRID